jgi:LacI family transcriptional regulator
MPLRRSSKPALPPVSKKTTLGVIAKECGVSVQTVSRVLAGKSKEKWPGMARRAHAIRAAAQRLGYRPNMAARSMQSSRFFQIGYFVASPDSSHLSHQADQAGICVAANDRNYHVSMILLPVEDASRVAPSIPRALTEACVDALVVANYMAIPPEIQEAIEASGVPVVYLNADAPRNAIRLDDLLGARTMTDHLIGKGYRDIAFVHIKMAMDAKDHYSVSERETGYTEAMREHGLSERVVVCENANCDQVLADLLTSRDRPEALFCYEDLAAMVVQRVARRVGLSIPADLALAGYNDDYSAKFSPVPLTTMAVPFFDMGVAAAEMAIRLGENDAPKSLPAKVFVPELVVRESSARG